MINKLIFIAQCVVWFVLSTPVWVVGMYLVIFGGMCHWVADVLEAFEDALESMLDWTAENIITRKWKQ